MSQDIGDCIEKETGRGTGNQPRNIFLQKRMAQGSIKRGEQKELNFYSANIAEEKFLR